MDSRESDSASTVDDLLDAARKRPYKTRPSQLEGARYDAIERRLRWFDLNSKTFNKHRKPSGVMHFGALVVRKRDNQSRVAVGVLSYCGQGGTIALGPNIDKVTCKKCLRALAATGSGAE